MAPHSSATRTAILTLTSSGDNAVITAPASGPIRIYALLFTVDNATTITFKDSVVGAVSGVFNLTADGSSFFLPKKDDPWFYIAPGSNFVINMGSSVNLGGNVWYTTG